jgi:phosphatidate cytidylyltransferase
VGPRERRREGVPGDEVPRTKMTRVLSALLLIPLVLGVVWFLPPIGTLVLAACAAILACVEYVTLAGAVGIRLPRVLTAVAVVAACVSVGRASAPLEIVTLAALVLFGSAAVAAGSPDAGVLPRVAAALFAPIYLGVPLGAIAAIRTLGGREAVLLLMATIVISDSAQYYTGRAFGRAPLAPAISPKKTREGAIGGVLFGSAAMLAGGSYLFPAAPILALAITALAVVLAGIVGDLFESLLKRSAGVKDSSALIPGHGGVLDRIDSWLFAGPVYYVFIRYLQA